MLYFTHFVVQKKFSQSTDTAEKLIPSFVRIRIYESTKVECAKIQESHEDFLIEKKSHRFFVGCLCQYHVHRSHIYLWCIWWRNHYICLFCMCIPFLVVSLLFNFIGGRCFWFYLNVQDWLHCLCILDGFALVY
jgi:hypothetical protein